MEIKSVIEKMLSVEKEARRRIADADRQAEAILEDARREAIELSEKRLAQARETAAETTRRAAEQAAGQRDGALRAGKAGIDAGLTVCQGRKPAAVDWISRELLGTDSSELSVER